MNVKRYSPKATAARAAALAAASAICAAIHAGTSYLQSSGDSNTAALYTASCWDPAVAPQTSSGAATTDGLATDFVVKDGRTLKNTTASAINFKSLQLGASDFSSKGSFANSHAGQMIVSNLFLYSGQFSFADNKQQTLRGAATVYAPASNPFRMRFQGNLGDYMNISLTGAEGTCVEITTWTGTSGAGGGFMGNGYVMMQGDQSNYAGSWKIGPFVYIYAFSSSDNGGGGNTTSVMQFGKPLSTFNPAALIMQKGSKLRYEVGNPRTFARSDNRGLTLDARGGTVIYQLVNGFTHNFEWPIAGEGTFLATGRGKFVLKAQCDVTLSTDSGETQVCLGSGANITASGGLVLPTGHPLYLDSDTDRVTVNNLTTTNAMLCIPVSSDGTRHAQLRLAGNVNLTGLIGIGFTTPPLVQAETDLPVLVIDSSVQRTFTADDFSPYAVSGLQIPNATGVKVERDAETGDQVVSVTVVPYVRSSVSANATAYPNNAGNWAGGVLPAVGDGKNYILWNAHLRSGTEAATDIVMPGDRMVIYSPNNADHGATIKNASYSFGHLLALDHSFVALGGYGGMGGLTQTLAGNLEVRNTAGGKFEFRVQRSVGVLSATVTGLGRILVNCNDESTSVCSAEITGMNTGYLGTLQVSNSVAIVKNRFAFKISKEENLGGNPAAFSADAFLLGYGCIFTPTAAVTIDDPNRGVTFAVSTNTLSSAKTGVEFNLAHDFTVKTPVVFEGGAFAKRGVGILAWGRGGTTVETGATLAVEAGAVKPQGFDAFGEMSVSFAAGTALELEFPLAEGDSRATYGVDMRTASVSHADPKLAVRLTLGDAAAGPVSVATVPLATFSDAAAAGAFIAAAAVRAPRGYGLSLSVEERQLDGASAATVVASVVKIGTKFIIR